MHEITCPSCGSKYQIKPEQLVANLDANGQRKMRCSSCSHVFSIDPATMTKSADESEATQSDDLDLVVNKIDHKQDDKPIDSRNPFERKDPKLDFGSGAQGKPKQPRKVGFVANTPTTPLDQDKGGDPADTKSDDPVLDRIRRQILEEEQAERKSSRWLISFATICLFLLLLGVAIFWLLQNEPDWAKPSNWFAQAEDNAASNSDSIEDEIRAMPLGKPKISNQKIVTRPTDDEGVNELDLAGVIQNTESYAIRLEQIRAIALDEEGTVLRSWTFSAGARTMAAGQVMPFSNKSPITAGEREIIKFGWESDIARLPEIANQ